MCMRLAFWISFSGHKQKVDEQTVADLLRRDFVSELRETHVGQAKKASTMRFCTSIARLTSFLSLLLATMATQEASGAGTGGQWSTNITYASDNYLQTYDVFRPAEPPPSQQQSYWVIYIHGGFFRDPLVLADSFHPTVDILASALGHPSASHVAGYATLNYRLSQHANHTQPPETPAYDSRNASWPEHLDDVLAGIKQLQATYHFGSNYLLAGHSVGAQMALLVALKAKDKGIVAPRMVLGLSGIYDFPLIHQDHPEYRNLTFNAMKEGEEIAASPTTFPAEAYEQAGVERVLLGHSRDDGLVPWNQVERMVGVLEKAKRGSDYVSVVELHGKHNDIWRDGKESSRAIQTALGLLHAL